jgi:hypothetical protein
MSTPTLTLDDQEADFIFAMAGKYSRKAAYTVPENKGRSGVGVACAKVRAYLVEGGRQFYDEDDLKAPVGAEDVDVWTLCMVAEANERSMASAALARAIRRRLTKYDGKYVLMMG